MQGKKEEEEASERSKNRSLIEEENGDGRKILLLVDKRLLITFSRKALGYRNRVINQTRHDRLYNLLFHPRYYRVKSLCQSILYVINSFSSISFRKKSGDPSFQLQIQIQTEVFRDVA